MQKAAEFVGSERGVGAIQVRGEGIAEGVGRSEASARVGAQSAVDDSRNVRGDMLGRLTHGHDATLFDVGPDTIHAPASVGGVTGQHLIDDQRSRELVGAMIDVASLGEFGTRVAQRGVVLARRSEGAAATRAGVSEFAEDHFTAVADVNRLRSDPGVDDPEQDTLRIRAIVDVGQALQDHHPDVEGRLGVESQLARIGALENRAERAALDPLGDQEVLAGLVPEIDGADHVGVAHRRQELAFIEEALGRIRVSLAGPREEHGADETPAGDLVGPITLRHRGGADAFDQVVAGQYLHLGAPEPISVRFGVPPRRWPCYGERMSSVEGNESHLSSGPQSWAGRVAVVTGASSGIGEAVAERLAHLGMKVVLVARRAERLEALAKRLSLRFSDRPSDPRGDRGRATLSVVADLTQDAEILRVFEETRAAFGGVDVLVNNAGLGLRAALMDGDPAHWRRMLDLNVIALSLCTREAVQDMQRRGAAGHVFHISSMAAHRVTGPGSGMYSASKYAVRALTEALRVELRAAGSPIRVTAISPGFVETEFAQVYAHGDAAAAEATYSRFKVLESKDVADALAHALTAPSHVSIHDILMRATDQPR